MSKITRIGVYAVHIKEGKMLLIKQRSGPFAGRYDFPGGGLEFGESVEEALKREFAEEVGMSFGACHWLCNLTSLVPTVDGQFYQIGLIYEVSDLHPISSAQLDFEWVDRSHLTEANCAPLLWKYIIR